MHSASRYVRNTTESGFVSRARARAHLLACVRCVLCRKRLVENCTRRLTDGDIQNVLAQCRVALATERGGTGRGEAEGWMGGRQAEKKGGRSWPRRGSRTSTRSRCVRSFVRSFVSAYK